MKKSLKVFLACFLGGGIGTLTALQINGYFWWLGLLVGGLVGYLFYEFKKVLQAIPKAYRAVTRIQFYPRNFGKSLLGGLSMTLWLVSIFGLFGLTTTNTANLVMLLIAFSSLATFAGLLTGFVFGFQKKISKEDKKIVEGFWRYNILFVCFYHLPIWTVKGIIYLVSRTPKFIWKVIVALGKAIIILTRFIKTLFIMIHSEIRLLCGIDAMIGAVIGYFAGSVKESEIFEVL